MEKKVLKKAYKKAKRRNVQPWKALGIIAVIFALLLWPIYGALNMFDNTVAAFVGGTFWELENEDPNAVYFSSDFSSAEEMTDYGLVLCQRVEEEGAALLLNNNNALPLDRDSKVSCFSSSSVDLVYGGTGSGNIDASTADNLRTSLGKAGININEKLWKFYTEGEGSKYVRDGGGFTSSAAVGEVPWQVYTDEVLDSVAEYGDAAIVVLSRVGGEGVDLEYSSRNYLALDANERDMLFHIREMKDSGIVKKIVVLINSANALQVDFLKNNEYDIDAVLWIGDVGISGVNAVAAILAGAVNPSGSLVDTYCYDNYSSPAMCNFTPAKYQGDTKAIPSNAGSYMVYQEGIYVGYKYYETRYEDAVLGQGNAGDYNYDNVVAFPFGYGLSYTSFEYRDMSVSYNAAADRYELTVTVANTGRMAGKEPVQVYAQMPYTDYDRENKIEKASVQLVGFGKTGLVQPGESETLTIAVDRRELAAYDAYGAGTYILDAGDYYLTCATDAHNAVNNVIEAKRGANALTYHWTEAAPDTTSYASSRNGTAIANQLSSSDLNLYEGSDASVTYLSRSDWTGTWPADNRVSITLTEQLIRELQDIRYDTQGHDTVAMPTMGADNGLALYDMIGLDYDDPKWEELLDQMSYDEMVTLITDAFHWTMPVESVNAPGTRDENGPQGLTASLLGSSGTQLTATAFTSEDVMAATFNIDLMTEIGKVIGNNCLQAGIACLYGPGNNIHRTPYGGRNFEYYSEDGFLSGKMSQYEVAAIQAKGVHVLMKHFALNDCEQDRIGLGVWLTEQAAREIYLKAFQAPLEEGDGNGVMMAYTRWGTSWSGGNQGLGNIMRGEWGCNGMNITDNVLTTYVNGPDGILAGTTIYDAMMPYATNSLKKRGNDPVIVAAAREACHHNLYAIANSCGMNGVGENTRVKATRPVILTLVLILACIFTVIAVVMIAFWVRGGRKLRLTQEYRDYKAFRKGKKG